MRRTYRQSGKVDELAVDQNCVVSTMVMDLSYQVSISDQVVIKKHQQGRSLYWIREMQLWKENVMKEEEGTRRKLLVL